MYVFAQENGHDVWREWYYTYTLGALLQANLYMIHEDQVFVVDVMVTNPTWETVVTSVINWTIGVDVKFNAIVKIRMYKRFHEAHRFVMMVM
jgi:hypothetical protein